MRRSRRRRETRGKAMLVLMGFGGFVAIAVVYAYVFFKAGTHQSHQQIEALEGRVGELSRLDADHNSEIGTLKSDVQSRDSRIASLEKELATLAPDERTRKIVVLAKNKLAAGVDFARIQALILASDAPRSCNDPTTRHLVVGSKRTGRTGSWVRFGDAVTITATQSGSSFEADKPVSVNFEVIGGDTQTIEGVLPLHNTVIAVGKEFRFTVSPGEKGGAEVSGTRCDVLGGKAR